MMNSRRIARQIAYELLTKPDVANAVRAGEALIAATAQTTRNDVVAGLLDAIEQAKINADPAAQIRGWAEIGRLCGYYQPERTVKVDINIAAKRAIGQMEVMSDAELLTMIGSDSAPES